MITTLAIWWLRKTNKSVIINFKMTNGEVQAKERYALIFDNEFTDIVYMDSNGERVTIPSRKFTITRWWRGE